MPRARLPRFVPVVLLAIAAGGCGPERGQLREEIAPSRAQLVREGKATYERACASCHGIDARGDGPVASSLKVRPANLTQLARRNGGVFPRAKVVAIVTGETPIAAHGTRDMPIWRLRFGPTGSGAAAAASLRTLRWLDGMVDYLETIQEPS
jgi:mono/diheme cytochrome c family protein